MTGSTTASRGDTRVSRGRSLGAVVTAVLAGIALLAAIATVSNAAGVDTTENRGNTFRSGDVVLADDDQGNALFAVPALAPGATVTRCIRVSYTGSLPADVHLYSATGGSGLDRYLDTTVEVGTGGNATSCNGFVPTSVLFTGTMQALGAAHTNFSNGLAGFDGATDPSARTYRVSATLRDDQAAQNLTATLDLVWEAQNT